MVCLLLGFSFLVAFVAFDMVLLGYFCDRLHMGVFSTAFLFLGSLLSIGRFSFYLDFILFGGLRSFEPWG